MSLEHGLDSHLKLFLQRVADSFLSRGRAGRVLHEGADLRYKTKFEIFFEEVLRPLLQLFLLREEHCASCDIGRCRRFRSLFVVLVLRLDNTEQDLKLALVCLNAYFFQFANRDHLHLVADPRYHLLQCAFKRSQKLGQTRVLSTALILFLLRPDYKSFWAFNRIYGLLKVVFL